MAKVAQQGGGHTFVFPQGYDKTELKKFSDRIKAEFKQEHAARARQLAKDAAALTEAAVLQGKALGIDPKAAEKASLAANRKIKAAAREVPPYRPAKVLTGHNPTRFPPYEAAGWYASNGGIYGYERRGPDRNTGLTGAYLDAMKAGHAYIAHDVGVFFFATATGTLNLTVHTQINGVAAVYSTLFSYATAYAALRASIAQFSPFRRAASEAVIYRLGNVVALNIWRPAIVAGFSATVTMPVTRNTMCFLSGGAVQNVAAGGLLFPYALSNFRLPILSMDCFIV
jgi:hypothetical protein